MLAACRAAPAEASSEGVAAASAATLLRSSLSAQLVLRLSNLRCFFSSLFFFLASSLRRFS